MVFRKYWFALPLIALQYTEIYVELEIKAFKKLYTIIDTNEQNTASYGKRIRPDSETYQNISQFTNNYNFNINPRLECEYIFLDEEERKRFAKYDHEYLITQPFLTEKSGTPINQSIEETYAKLIPALNPVKFITWVIKRDDMPKINEWNNSQIGS